MDAPRDEQKTPNLETLASDFTNFCDGVNHLVNAASVWWQANRPAVEALVDRLPALIAGLPKYVKEQPGKAVALAEAGWCLPPTEPLDFVTRFSEVLDQGDQGEQLDKELTTLFAVDGESYQMLSNFLLSDEVPTGFRRLLEECIEAHRRKMYYVAIAGLFSAIEGMMAECTGNIKKKTFKPKGHLETSVFFKALVERKEEMKTKMKMKDLVSLTILPVADALWTFLNNAYGCHDFSDEESPDFVNRHWVAHGRDLEYGTETNSLKLLLAVSAILWYADLQAEWTSSETDAWPPT